MKGKVFIYEGHLLLRGIKMRRIKKIIKSRREPKTFRGQSRRRLTGDGRRTIKSKGFF